MRFKKSNGEWSRISYPSSLNLNQNQIDSAEEWAKDIPYPDENEDCCMSSDFTFTVYATGIGDCIYINHDNRSHYLDDGLEA